jgi:hypothetical protein
MNFFRSMEIDPTCKFSPPQSRSEGISFYGFSAPRRFHATKTQSGTRPQWGTAIYKPVKVQAAQYQEALARRARAAAWWFAVEAL